MGKFKLQFDSGFLAKVRKDTVKKLARAKQLSKRQQEQMAKELDDDLLRRLMMAHASGKPEFLREVREDMDVRVRKVIAWKTVN